MTKSTNVQFLPSLDSEFNSEIDFRAKDANQITIANISGKLDKFLSRMVCCGLLSADNKADLKQLYHLNENREQWTKEEENNFNCLLDKLIIPNNKATFRMVGPLLNLDTVSSRFNRANYFIIKLLNSLKKNTQIQIIHSNQSMGEQLNIIEKNINLYVNSNCYTEFIEPLYSQARLIDYTIDKDNQSITLYSAGLICKKTIIDLAQSLEIPFDENSVTDFLKTLDTINLKFNEAKTTNKDSPIWQKFNFVLSNKMLDAINFADSQIAGTPIAFVNALSDQESTKDVEIFSLGNFAGNCQVVCSKELNLPSVSVVSNKAEKQTQTFLLPNIKSTATKSNLSSDNIFAKLHDKFTHISCFSGHREANLADFAYMIAFLKIVLEPVLLNRPHTLKLNESCIHLNLTEKEETEKEETAKDKNELFTIKETIEYLILESKLSPPIKENESYYHLRSQLKKMNNQNILNQLKEYYSYYFIDNMYEESTLGKWLNRYSNEIVINAVKKAEEQIKEKKEKITTSSWYHC